MRKLNFHKIHHVAVIVSDYEKSRRFYVDLLGFEVIREHYREEQDDYKLDLRLGDCELEIFGKKNAPARPTQPEACGLRHLAFAVEDLDQALEALHERGIETEPVRRDAYTGCRMTFFHDPDHLPLELQEVGVKKKNVMLVGFMGTGKSSVAAWLGRQRGFEVVEMDALVEETEGMTINEIFEKQGEAYFRDVESRLLKEAAEKERVVISCGGGVVLREENVRMMRERGTVVLLTAKPETIYRRVCGSEDRPLLKDNMSVEKIAGMMEGRREAYQKAADVVIATDGKTVEEIGKEIAIFIRT